MITVAKNAMKMIAKISPKTNKVVSSRAIAATANTLSIDMDTSAIVIVTKARNKVRRCGP